MVRNGDGGVVIGDVPVNDDGRRVINLRALVINIDGWVGDNGRRVMNHNSSVMILGSLLRTPTSVGRVFI